MSQENVRVVQDLYAAFAKRDIATIMDRVAADFVLEQSTAVPWGGTYHGPNGMVSFLGKLGRHLNNEGLPIDRYIDAGDHVVAIGRTHGTVEGSGKPFNVPVAHVWEIREGKAVSFRPFIDLPTMMACLR